MVPPVVADSPSVFPPLPTEDETWGGNGGGQGRDGKHDHRPWVKEFAILAAMPCKTAEERQVRDRKAFLLHSLFVDVAVLKAVASIQQLISNHTSSHETANGTAGPVLYTEQVGDMKIIITKDKADASSKLDVKLDGSQAPGMSPDELARRNLLKGITADESATVHVRLPSAQPFIFPLPFKFCQILKLRYQFTGYCYSWCRYCKTLWVYSCCPSSSRS